MAEVSVGNKILVEVIILFSLLSADFISLFSLQSFDPWAADPH